MKPNVILITIDSLRGDFVNYKYMPNLMRIIEKREVATFNAFTAGMPTYYAFPSIIHGIYPFKFGKKINANKQLQTIAEVFTENGYFSLGLSAGNIYTSSYTGYDRGFSAFEDFLPKSNIKRTIKKRLNSIPLIGKIAKSSLAFLGSQKRRLNLLRGKYYPFPGCENILSIAFKELSSIDELPYFLWIHLMDVHEPYIFDPAKSNFSLNIQRAILEPKRGKLWAKLIIFLRENLSKGSLNVLDGFIEKMQEIKHYNHFFREIYSLSVKSVDEHLSKFIESILSNHPNTFFLITSDHGEEFFDLTTYGHFPLFHNDAVVRIPFIVIGPETVVKNLHLPDLISNVDVPPTLCDLAGISSPAYYDGVSVFSSSAKNRKIVFTETLFGVVPEIGRNEYPSSNLLVSAHDSSKSSSVLETHISPRGSYTSNELSQEAFKFLKSRQRQEKLLKALEKKAAYLKKGRKSKNN